MYISNVKDESVEFYHEYVEKSTTNVDCYPKKNKDFAIVFIAKGKIFMRTGEGTAQVSNSDVVFIPKNTFVKFVKEENEEVELFCVYFSEKLLDCFRDLIKNVHELKRIHCFDKKELVALFERMEFYSLHASGGNFADVIQVFLKELALLLKTYESPFALYQNKECPPILIDILRYINENLRTIKKVSEISSVMYISYSYLVKLFKSYLKTTPKKYLIEQRLFVARKLIEEGKKPTSVCEICGFETYSIFYRCYVSRFGYSPSKQLLQNEEEEVKTQF